MRGGLLKSSSQSSVIALSFCEVAIMCATVDFFFAEVDIEKHLSVTAAYAAHGL